jgi:hypothetical protein
MTLQRICEGFDCSEYAKNTIQVKLGEASSISLHLCNNCVRIFHTQESYLNKNVIEQQQVVRPACSNTSSYNQPIQQHRVLLDD